MTQPPSLSSLFIQHAEVTAEMAILNAGHGRPDEIKEALHAREREEQTLRNQLLEFKPDSIEGAEAKLIYFTVMLGITRATMKESDWMKLKDSLVGFL